MQQLLREEEIKSKFAKQMEESRRAEKKHFNSTTEVDETIQGIGFFGKVKEQMKERAENPKIICLDGTEPMDFSTMVSYDSVFPI